MAVATLLADSLVESVKQAVKSASTCSNTTVSSLQTLLRSPTTTSAIEADASRKIGKTTKSSATVTRTKSSRGVRSKTSVSNAALHPSVEKEGARLSPHEKLVLATEIFNTTLKTLSDASKTPLQPTSPNRITASPRKSKASKSAQIRATDTECGIIAAAECARLALSCLRTLKSEQGSQENGYPNIQLEQGACVLAGRLMSLGLNDLAYKELRVLKRRIQQYLDGQSRDQKTNDEPPRTRDGQEEEPGKDRLWDLLTFTDLSNAGPLYGLLVSFQSNALRLIASEKKSSMIPKIFASLQLSNPSSPANVIMDAVQSKSITNDKAALQLQLLSNTALSMSAVNAHKSTESGSSTTGQSITSLNLQLLALEIRCLGWKLSGHLFDEGKEMWDPLARYLSSFAHQNAGVDRSDFASIYKNIRRLQTAVAEMKRKPSSNSKDTNLPVKTTAILGQLAQEAGCFEEALKLFEEALTPLCTGQSIALGTVRCKIASVHFQVLRSSGKSSRTAISASLTEATTALGLQLKGSAHDLDELLVEAAKLKKLAMAWFGDAVSKDREKTQEGMQLHSRVREYLQGFVRFLRRYIGNQPQEDSQSKEHEYFQKRLQTSKNIAFAAVDSALAVGKLSVMSQRPPWEEVLIILGDCQRLLMTLDAAVKEKLDTLEIDSIGMGFVKLSNLFWSRYLKEREGGKGYNDLLPLLKQSTNLLSSCSPSERDTGFAALKYERLAHLCLEGNMSKESERAFIQSIKEHIATGAIDRIVSDSAGNHPHRIGQDPKSAGFALNRVLSAFLRAKIRRKEARLQDPFDDELLGPGERGLLLELQMRLLTELQHHAQSDEGFRSIFSSVLIKLLQLYLPHTHPIRRARVILSGLRFALEHPNSIEPTLLQKLIEEGVEYAEHEADLADDLFLEGFARHIRNSLRLTVGLHKGHLQSHELNELVSSWTYLLRNCKNRKSLESCIDDTEYWILQLKAVIDYTEIHGLWKIQLAALEMVLRTMELQEPTDLSVMIILLSRLAVQYCRLGYCKKSGDLLARVDQHLGQHKVNCLAVISHKLARVEYFLETGDVDLAAGTLSAAQTLYESNQDSQEMASSTYLAKIAWERLVADAAYIRSRLAFIQGSTTHALFFAKLSVRLNCRIWAKLEKLSQRKQGKSLQSSTDSSISTVIDEVANLSISNSNTTLNTSISYARGAPFWPHIGSHHTCLLNLAILSAHHGLFQDAIYYGEQALKINKSLNADVRLIACQAQLGSHWIFGGHLPEGQELLRSALELSKGLENSIELVSLQMSLAALYKAQGHYDEESLVLLEADRLLSDIVRTDATDSILVASSISDLEGKMEKLRVRGSSRRPQQQPATSRRTRATTTKQSSRKAAIVDVGPSLIESKSLLRLRGDILQHQAACLRALRDFEKATAILNDARPFATSADSQISLRIEESEHLLADAIRRFASHAVYCILPESTISLPSLQPSSTAQEDVALTTESSTTSRRTKLSARGTRSRARKATEDFTIMLSKAGDCLNEILPAATILGSTLDSHAASRLMSRISMLSHATAPGCSTAWSQDPANVNEIGRIGAFARERMAIDIDKQLAEYSDPLLWPTSSISTVQLDRDVCSNFMKDYVDILPENWNIISLSLSADHTEFVVSKLCSGQSPFLLRLPLKRGTSDDDDEDEQFLFEDGRGEMQEIMRLANKTAHDAKHQTDRQSKKEWWTIRQTVDRRLENLLQNIENVWFGGFRGIFSPAPRRDVLLSRFASSFQNILDKHLPSRRKGSSGMGSKLTLHQNVLELFIGLRDLADQEDPEDCLMDLLYFVVDILQFQGERNAYDEIDFDMMVVETLDALRSHHEAVQREQEEQPVKHTVLVLDKALHMFPWESLPCLQGFPVSRVPSLECLRDRILQFRKGLSCKGQMRACIDRTNGTYILNPAGDLRTTQDTFEKDLAALNIWTGIAKREPSEEEFREALESKSLFLYFGHGSGAQYIRGRTIKRLDRCAVTFLMGCSSGSLTEAGEYEPYGTPMNYLHAGCPALVATLWDVTDKDIDRFSQSTFETWGLTGDGREAAAVKKGKARALKVNNDSVECHGSVALDEAVAKSRSSCVLKYLNGAAPVIYGIPVFLE